MTVPAAWPKCAIASRFNSTLMTLGSTSASPGDGGCPIGRGCRIGHWWSCGPVRAGQRFVGGFDVADRRSPGLQAERHGLQRRDSGDIRVSGRHCCLGRAVEQRLVEIGDRVERHARFGGHGQRIGGGLFRFAGTAEYVDHAGTLQFRQQGVQVGPVVQQLVQLPDRAGAVDQDQQVALAYLQRVAARGQGLAAIVRLDQDGRLGKHRDSPVVAAYPASLRASVHAVR